VEWWAGRSLLFADCGCSELPFSGTLQGLKQLVRKQRVQSLGADRCVSVAWSNTRTSEDYQNHRLPPFHNADYRLQWREDAFPRSTELHRGHLSNLN